MKREKVGLIIVIIDENVAKFVKRHALFNFFFFDFCLCICLYLCTGTVNVSGRLFVFCTYFVFLKSNTWTLKYFR